MTIGIGIDIINHSDIINLKWLSDENFLNRYFTIKEREHIDQAAVNEEKQLKCVAGHFAAKEAVLKCLGIGMLDGYSLKDIHVNHSEDGQPLAAVSGTLLALTTKKGITSLHVSISHSTTSTIAIVLAEG